MNRRNRLSRSRDFEAVYRNGRSVSTRYLTLYEFVRPGDDAKGVDPRLGLAVSRQVGGAAVRNRIKRQLRACFDLLQARVPAERDYVLIVRPALADAADGHGFDWLVERVDEVFELASRQAAPATVAGVGTERLPA